MDYLYNARNNDAGSYYICRGRAEQGFARANPGRVLIRPGEDWYCRDVAHPKPFLIGGELRVYFSGYDGVWGGMGIAVGDLDHLEVVGRVFGPGKGWENRGPEAGLRKHTPFFDGDWWLAYNGGGIPGASIGLARSHDGLTWERSGRMLKPFAGWGSHHVTPGPMVRDGKLYAFFSGHDGEYYRPGLAWLDGDRWQRFDSPILPRRTGSSRCEIEGDTVRANTAGFVVGETVWIFDRHAGEDAVIVGMDDGVIRLDRPIAHSYDHARIRSWAYGSMTAEDIYHDGTQWRLLLTCFHAVPGLTRELMGVATAPSIEGPWTLSTIAPNRTNRRDRVSFENPCLVRAI